MVLVTAYNVCNKLVNDQTHSSASAACSELPLRLERPFWQLRHSVSLQWYSDLYLTLVRTLYKFAFDRLTVCGECRQTPLSAPPLPSSCILGLSLLRFPLCVQLHLLLPFCSTRNGFVRSSHMSDWGKWPLIATLGRDGPCSSTLILVGDDMITL